MKPASFIPAVLLPLLLAVPTPADACSPAPCITASPNPVGVVVPQTQGTTVLEWNAAATLTPPTIVVEAPGVPVATYPVAAQGTQQITVQVSKTYTARLVLKDRTGEKLLASVQIPVKPKLNIPGPEQIGTVKNVKVIPRGTWVELQFTAPFSSKAAVWISKNPPQGNSEQGLQVVRYAPAVGGNQIQHTKKLYDIAPDTKFYYLIRTTSQNGLRAHASGDFRTLRRFAKVSIDKIYVIDDSDDLSAGDLAFSFHLNGGSSKPGGASLLGPGTGGPLAKPVTVDSGETLTVGKTFEVETSADSIKLNNTGIDDDGPPTGIAFYGPSCDWSQPFVGSYSDLACDRAGATLTFQGLGPQGPGQETFEVASFQHSVGGGALRFRVYGRVWVYYK